MNDHSPSLITILHDDYKAAHIGNTGDGRQFFLTNPFVPATGGLGGREFIALYLFDSHGQFLEARIDDLGPRKELDRSHARSFFDQRMAELGPVHYGRIEVCPFQLERFGAVFGLVPYPPDSEEDKWSVSAEPGDYMAFHSPWDSGDYDT